MKNLLPPFLFHGNFKKKERRQRILYSSLSILHFLSDAFRYFLKLFVAQLQLQI